MKKYSNSQIQDLLLLISTKGDCIDIPCYEDDCPIYHWCKDTKSFSNNAKNDIYQYVLNIIKSLPQEELFEAML